MQTNLFRQHSPAKLVHHSVIGSFGGEKKNRNTNEHQNDKNPITFPLNSGTDTRHELWHSLAAPFTISRRVYEKLNSFKTWRLQSEA